MHEYVDDPLNFKQEYSDVFRTGAKVVIGSALATIPYILMYFTYRDISYAINNPYMVTDLEMIKTMIFYTVPSIAAFFCKIINVNSHDSVFESENILNLFPSFRQVFNSIIDLKYYIKKLKEKKENAMKLVNKVVNEDDKFNNLIYQYRTEISNLLKSIKMLPVNKQNKYNNIIKRVFDEFKDNCNYIIDNKNTFNDSSNELRTLYIKQIPILIDLKVEIDNELDKYNKKTFVNNSLGDIEQTLTR